MTIQTSVQFRIQQSPDFWYTVENINIETGFDGCTISYWESCEDSGGKRIQHITMNEEEALAIAGAIHRLFKD